MNHLIVAFYPEHVSQRICEMLSASSLPVRTVCSSGAEVIRAVNYMGGGAVVCGMKLPDMTADELADSLEEQASILVVAKPEQLEYCENPHLFRLPLPVNRYDLSASVRMLIQAEEMKRAVPKPSRSDQETIAQAKRLLQATCAISEEEAHRFLQKKSMAAHRKMADVAADIVRGGKTGGTLGRRLF